MAALVSSTRDLSASQPAEPIVTVADVQKVHILIERCISRCLTKEQTVCTLARLGVDPRFTTLVWARLESENPAFFAAYQTKLDVTAGLGALALAA